MCQVIKERDRCVGGGGGGDGGYGSGGGGGSEILSKLNRQTKIYVFMMRNRIRIRKKNY